MDILSESGTDMQDGLNWGMDTVAARVKHRRSLLQLTQAELARLADMRQSDVSKIENGDIAQPRKLAQLAKALRCDPYWLATGEGFPVSPSERDGYAAEDMVRWPQLLGPGNFVPVLDLPPGEAAPEVVDAAKLRAPGHLYGEIVSLDDGAFLVPVRDLDMLPKFNPGEFVLIEPREPIDVEDDVLVRFTDGRLLLRRLISRRGAIRLGGYGDTGSLLTCHPDIVSWMHFAAYPVPGRKVKRWPPAE